MHSNVWEWCLDQWHNPDEGAPSDGSAWLKPKARDDVSRLLSGGSWFNSPGYCRSACRSLIQAVLVPSSIGLRVVCLPQDLSLST